MDLKGTMVAAALSFVAAVPASAATKYNLTATSQSQSYSDFSLTYLDTDLDSLFSFNELITFSGVTIGANVFGLLVNVPVVSGISDGGYDTRYAFAASDDFWIFGAPFNSPFGSAILLSSVSAPTFIYETSPIPLPAGLPLLITGLAGFAGLRMRKKRAAQV